jgi:hypothetical protein
VLRAPRHHSASQHLALPSLLTTSGANTGTRSPPWGWCVEAPRRRQGSLLPPPLPPFSVLSSLSRFLPTKSTSQIASWFSLLPAESCRRNVWTLYAGAAGPSALPRRRAAPRRRRDVRALLRGGHSGRSRRAAPGHVRRAFSHRVPTRTPAKSASATATTASAADRRVRNRAARRRRRRRRWRRRRWRRRRRGADKLGRGTHQACRVGPCRGRW